MSKRKDLVATAQRMSALGLTPGMSGNVSVRTKHGFLVTPSGLPYDELRLTDLRASCTRRRRLALSRSLSGAGSGR